MIIRCFNCSVPVISVFLFCTTNANNKTPNNILIETKTPNSMYAYLFSVFILYYAISTDILVNKHLILSILQIKKPNELGI